MAVLPTIVEPMPSPIHPGESLVMVTVVTQSPSGSTTVAVDSEKVAVRRLMWNAFASVFVDDEELPADEQCGACAGKAEGALVGEGELSPKVDGGAEGSDVGDADVGESEVGDRVSPTCVGEAVVGDTDDGLGVGDSVVGERLVGSCEGCGPTVNKPEVWPMWTPKTPDG